jgi:hypothetical protein
VFRLDLPVGEARDQRGRLSGEQCGDDAPILGDRRLEEEGDEGSLVDAVDDGDTVVVPTGFPIPQTTTETDGPPGAVPVARLIDRGLGGYVVLACDPGAVEVCGTAANSGGDRRADAGGRATGAASAEPKEYGPECRSQANV